MELQLSDNCYKDFKILDADGVDISKKLLIETLEIKVVGGARGDPLTKVNITCYLDKASIKVFDKDVNVYYHDKLLTLDQRELINEILEITPTK